MFKNYLLVAYRNLVKSKFYSSVNIAGLAFGLTCVYFIAQYLQTETSYDRFHENASDIYRISWHDENPQTRTPHPMAQALVNDFPEVESGVSITPLWGMGLTRETFSIRNIEKNIRYDESGVMAVDTTFFKVFTFPLVLGDPDKVLKQTDGILLSESMAKKYFGDENPMGKTLTVNDELETIEVVGVFKDVPATSHFHFDFLVSYLGEKQSEDPESQYYTWNDFGHYNYIRLKPGTGAKALESKLMPWIRQYLNVSDEMFMTAKARGFYFRLDPITDIHLHSHIRWELESNGYISYVYMMAVAAILILVIATVNFINLTAAQSSRRLKEIGIRKSLGAIQRQLLFQFTAESLLVSTLAMGLALVLIEIAGPFIRQFTGYQVAAPWILLPMLAAMSLLSGFAAGVFPSWHLAVAKPVAILRGQLAVSPKGKGFRQSFTAFQFVASMVLICCSVIIYSQIRFIQSRSLGFNQDVTIIPVKDFQRLSPKIDELRNELLRIPGVESVSASSNVPGKSYNQNPAFATKHPDHRVAVSESMVDVDFFNTMEITLKEGRFFDRNNPADRQSFILNESAARALFPDGAVGQELSWDFDAGLVKGNVIGVVSDFHFQSLHEPVRPLLFVPGSYYNYVIIKVAPGTWTSAEPQVATTWKKFEDRFFFESYRLADQLDQQYASEKNLAGVLTGFAGIAVAIACLGLLGIATITFRQKTKEVCVRKVMGASLRDLTFLLLSDFTKIVIVAVLLSVPLVWWLMNNWLQHFTYRIGINPLVFAGAGALLIAISWITLGYLTLRVASINPADTLKRE